MDAPYIHAPPAGSFVTDPEKYRQIGLGLIGGIPTAGLASDIDEYVRHGGNAEATWFVDSAGTGGDNGQFTLPGGVFQLSSGATPNSRREHIAPCPVTNSKTKLWYFAVRFSMVTGFDAQGRAYFGIRSADITTESLVVGAVGAVDTANFVLQYGGHFAGSKVVLGALDIGVFHIAEVWNSDRNSYNVRFDGGLIQNAVPAAPTWTGGTGLARGANNGTTAANRAINLDWHVYLGERA